MDGGVLMTDIVNYQLPIGFIESIANKLVIKGQHKEIFDFRTKKIKDLFGIF
jgi:ligand-binding SRPBCC domain-containing protein